MKATIKEQLWEKDLDEFVTKLDEVEEMEKVEDVKSSEGLKKSQFEERE